MSAAFVLAVVSTFTIDGTVTATGGDYALVEIEVPAGVSEMEIVRDVPDGGTILDFGLFDPMGFRGWSGGLRAPIVVGSVGASRGYLAGPMTEGTWRLIVGKAKVVGADADYSVTLILRDAATIDADPSSNCEFDAIESGARFYAGDFHVHSSESGDAEASPDDIAALMEQRGLDFAFITDHNTIAGRGPLCRYRNEGGRVLLAPGVEITTYGGHGNAFGIRDYVDHRVGENGRSMEDIVSEVHEQGGLFSVNHPALAFGGLCIGCLWEQGDEVLESVDAIELHTGNYEVSAGTFTPVVADLWDRILDTGARVTAIAGSDDHRAGTGTGGTESPIGSPTTMVFADELSEASLLAGVKAGRVYIKLRGPEDPDIDVSVTTDAEEEGRLGDTVSGSRATVSAQVQGAAGMTAVFVVSGSEVHRAEIGSDSEEIRHEFAIPEGGGRVRVHVVESGLEVVITNHVFLEFEEVSGGGGCGGHGRGPAWLLLMLLLGFGYRFHARHS